MDRKSELIQALIACRVALVSVGVLSAFVNVLYLTGSFFMLQVYDRVLTSQSIPTLIGLCSLALFLYLFQAVLDVLRSRLLIRVGRSLDTSLSGRVFDVMIRSPLLKPGKSESLQPLRDLDQVRSFVSSTAPSAMFDVPWMPLYLLICFIFHVWIGIAATLGGAILFGLTLLIEFRTKNTVRKLNTDSANRSVQAERCRRNAEVIEALGMGARAGEIWQQSNTRFLDGHQDVSDVTGGLGAISKVFRACLQSGILALGALLVIKQEATAGIIIASSILTSRALAPLESVIGQWKGFTSAREAWQRLTDLLKDIPETKPSIPLPAPTRSVAVEGVTLAPPGSNRIVVSDVTFSLTSGQGLGVIGQSASGKSSLVRALVGVWQPLRGKVRLDGAALDQWTSEQRGPFIGYLPQDVELFSGTIAENIARFQEAAEPRSVFDAASAAGVHEMILRLPQGYATQIGESGQALSAGQRQRVALARALYGDPFLVVLDEPNSNLDGEGELALTKAVEGVRARGGVVIVVAHRPSALQAVDHVMLMMDGRVKAFGAKEDVLAMISRGPPVPAPAMGQIR